MDQLTQFKTIPSLANVSEEDLQWYLDKSEEVIFADGDHIMRPGDKLDRLLIVTEGNAVLKIEQGGQFKTQAQFGVGTFIGYLPYSRGTTVSAYMIATEQVKALQLMKSDFKEMIAQCETLTEVLVHAMSTRIRTFTKKTQQNDKMMALGKLSAGLAHELNNPSAAIVRSAQYLKKHLGALPDKFKQVIKIRMEDPEVDVVNGILFSRIEAGTQELSMLEKSDREDEFMDWFDDHEIEEADELAENLADYNFSLDELEKIHEAVPTANLFAVLNWINQMLITERLVNEIQDASERINKLVTSVKSYSHMDQSPEKQKADINLGIENTLTLLNHKISGNNIQVERKLEKELPHPMVMPSEINQVWTNLIDNAIDAMCETDQRVLTVESFTKGPFINVIISDTGSGIPSEHLDRIYEPFFTTKAIGKGTGLGLELVHQIITQTHRGTIDVDSEPGNTKFTICFPINA